MSSKLVDTSILTFSFKKKKFKNEIGREREYLNSLFKRVYEGLQAGNEVCIAQVRIAHFLRHAPIAFDFAVRVRCSGSLGTKIYDLRLSLRLVPPGRGETKEKKKKNYNPITPPKLTY